MARIAVVGAGLAGLACGWRLRRAGHEVRVLERGAGVGGRARSERRGAFVLDTGCPVVAAGQRRVLALAREAGALGGLRPWGYGRDARWLDGRLVVPSRRDSFDLARELGGRLPRTALRAALDLQRTGRVFDPQGDASPEAALRGAASDALGWWPEPCDGEPVLAPILAALRGVLPQTAPHGFVSGLSALARALARRLDVATGCEVLRVETDSDGAHLLLREGACERRERADAVVVAAPAPRVASLCPKLTPEERGFFESARSRPATIVHLLFDEAPRAFSHRSVVFGRDAELEVASVLAEHAKPGAAPHGAGLLRVALAPEAAARMYRIPDASVVDLVLENLAYSPVGWLLPDDYAVWRHADAVPRFDLAHVRRLARFVRRLERSPRLVFAGDFLAGPSIDGAVASGIRAAGEIARWL